MTAVAAKARTCLDCPAQVTGRVKRCPACHAQRERKNRLERVRRHREKKAAGGTATNLPVLPKDATPLQLYSHGTRLLAEAKTVVETKSIYDDAALLREAAKLAQDQEAMVAATEIRFLAKRRLGEMIAAQKDETGLATGGQPYQSTSDPGEGVDRLPTLQELGVTHKLSSEAQKLAALPDFESRVEEWRFEAMKPGAKVPGTLAIKTPRKENDFYPTPMSIVNEIVARWKLPGKKLNPVWEPCCGDGRLAAALEEGGHTVFRSDIAEGVDFFEMTALPPPLAGHEVARLCTNPPFDRARAFIEHAFAIGVREMCLVLPERFWASDIGRRQFEAHRPAVWANLDWREDYLGKGGQANMALAVAIWSKPCAPTCRFEVWGRESQPGAHDG